MLLGIDLKDWNHQELSDPLSFAPDNLVRKVQTLRTCAMTGRTWQEAEPVHYNSKYKVWTPEGEFTSVSEAAKAYGISYRTAYARAVRGDKGWSTTSPKPNGDI